MLEFLIHELGLYDSDASDDSSLNFDDHELISFARPFPTLQKIAMVQLVGGVWRHPELETQVRDHHLKFHDSDISQGEKGFHDLEEKVKNKLEELLPGKLQKEAIVLVGSMGHQIFEWMGFMQRTCSDLCDSLSIGNFTRWKMIGSIDKRKTFESLLKMKNDMNALDLYRMSCYYCFEDHILSLGNDISGGVYYKQAIDEEGFFLVAHWTLSAMRMKGKSFHCDESKSKEMLKRSMTEGNSEAVRYFWFQLSEKFRKENVVKLAIEVICNFRRDDDVHSIEYQRCNEHAAMLCLFLSEMENGSQQMEVFVGYNEEILRLFFYNYPWRQFLLPILKNMWHEHNNVDPLDGDHFAEFLSSVAVEMENGGVEEFLVHDIWKESPLHYKQFFFYNIEDAMHTLLKMCKSKNVEIVRLILSDATVEDKKMIVRVMVESRYIYEFILADQIPTMEILLRECISSEDESSKLKGKVVATIGHKLCSILILRSNFEGLDKFLSWCLTNDDQIDHYKRNVMDKAAILVTLASHGKYEVLDKFLKWVFNSDEEISKFKIKVASSSGNTITVSLSHGDWNAFEKFLDWCFESDEEIVEFKKNLTPKMNIVVTKITSCGHTFEFNEKLLEWLFESEEEILRFKRQLVLSEDGREMFKTFVKRFERNDRDYLKRLAEWYRPLGNEVLSEFEAKLKREVTRAHQLKSSFLLLQKLNQMLGTGNEDLASPPGTNQGRRGVLYGAARGRYRRSGNRHRKHH